MVVCISSFQQRLDRTRPALGCQIEHRILDRVCRRGSGGDAAWARGLQGNSAFLVGRLPPNPRFSSISEKSASPLPNRCAMELPSVILRRKRAWPVFGGMLFNTVSFHRGKMLWYGKGHEFHGGKVLRTRKQVISTVEKRCVRVRTRFPSCQRTASAYGPSFHGGNGVLTRTQQISTVATDCFRACGSFPA
jgi:hypothetical protein